MTVDCLTCAEIEQKICDLADELSALSGCEGVKVSEGGTTFDYSERIESKKEVLRTYRELHRVKCIGSMDLYEFTHVPCVKPANCEGASCTTPSRLRMNRRRYRR